MTNVKKTLQMIQCLRDITLLLPTNNNLNWGQRSNSTHLQVAHQGKMYFMSLKL